MADTGIIYRELEHGGTLTSICTSHARVSPRKKRRAVKLATPHIIPITPPITSHMWICDQWSYAVVLFVYRVILRFFNWDHEVIVTSKSIRGRPSIEIRIQLFRVSLVIWLLRRVFILFILEKVANHGSAQRYIILKFNVEISHSHC